MLRVETEWVRMRFPDRRAMKREMCVPRLSVARATPPLNFTPTTDVPVTAGDEVCALGPLV